MRGSVLFAATGLLALAGLALLGGRVVESRRPPTPAYPVPEPPAATAPPAEVPPAVPPRPVAPGFADLPWLDAAELERVEPREPMSPPPGRLKRPPGPTLMHRPVAHAAGRIEANGLTIVPEGTIPVEPDEICKAGDGTVWPCGMMARTAFRAWLRGRAIACVLPGEEEEAGPDLTLSCRLGREDVGGWLVENGWARAAPGGPYEEAGRMAEREGRGVFRAHPPG